MGMVGSYKIITTNSHKAGLIPLRHGDHTGSPLRI